MSVASIRPLVSIVVPSYNQGKFISETIDSCLAQDYRPLQVVVMDGGSTDGTVAILKRYYQPEITWVSEQDGGVVDAVNKGLGKAAGEIITIQSSDDVFLPGAVTAAVGAFLAAPRLGLVYGDVELMDAASNRIGEDRQGEFDLGDVLSRFSYIPQPGTFFSREAWQSVGGWRRDVSYVADADLWLRIALRYPVAKLDRLVARYRYHDEQRDKHRGRIAADWRQMIEGMIAAGGLDAQRCNQARMGVHLAEYRYCNEDNWFLRTLALYRAALANPVGVLDARFPKRELVPGREPIWRMLSRVKRSLGFRPRVS